MTLFRRQAGFQEAQEPNGAVVLDAAVETDAAAEQTWAASSHGGGTAAQTQVEAGLTSVFGPDERFWMF